MKRLLNYAQWGEMGLAIIRCFMDYVKESFYRDSAWSTAE